MKKYISPNIDIQQALYQYIMAGSIDAHKEVGQGQFGNEGLFDDQESTYPSKDNGLWGDAND